jgi:hypothetical protein
MHSTLNSMEYSPWKLVYGSQMLITVLTKARHWSLYSVRWIQSIRPHSNSLRPALIYITAYACVFQTFAFPTLNIIIRPKIKYIYILRGRYAIVLHFLKENTITKVGFFEDNYHTKLQGSMFAVALVSLPLHKLARLPVGVVDRHKNQIQ